MEGGPIAVAKRHCAKLDELLQSRIRTCALRGWDIHTDADVQALVHAIAVIQREAARDVELSKMLELIANEN